MHVSSIDRKSRKVIRGPCGLWLLNDLKGPPYSNERGWPNEKWRVNKLQEWWDRTDRPNRRFASSISTELIAGMATYKCNLSSSLMASCSQSSKADMLVKAVRHKNADLMMMTCQILSDTWRQMAFPHTCVRSSLLHVGTSLNSHTGMSQMSSLLTGVNVSQSETRQSGELPRFASSGGMSG